jgi:hypothetical protein
MKPRARLPALLAAMLAAVTAPFSDPSLAKEQDVEAAVCGSMREPFTFWLWRRMAGMPDPGRIANLGRVQQIEFVTRDGIRLRGYKLLADSPRAYLLVAQGNAMLADQLAADLQYFRNAGLDVYVFDYRGYGISEGKSRLAAIVSDYRELITDLNARGYRRRFLYGLSMGGVILLNATAGHQSGPVSGPAAGRMFDAMVIDSSPSRISGLGCPTDYDPVRLLADDSSRISIMVGERDRVVPPAQIEELVREGAARHARIFRHPELAHPYQDQSGELHRLRQKEVAAFLLRVAD